MRRPRPERIIWTIAFLVFAIAAGCEVVGAATGWTPFLARLYYLTGAVLVVGLLALGELYLLMPGRMPAVTPGLALLVVAVAATAVWSAPVDAGRLAIDGWNAIARRPFLVALTASINAGGTLILVGGAAYSAWSLRSTPGAERRAAGCLLIALGAIVVAMGGTLTRFGYREYLYLAMALGVTVIFAGVMMTRSQRKTPAEASSSTSEPVHAEVTRGRLVPLRAVGGDHAPEAESDEGIDFIVSGVLPLDANDIDNLCRRWSAVPIDGDGLTRNQARDVWALRLALPEEARTRFDQLPLPVQGQLAELYLEVWSRKATAMSRVRGA